MLINAVTNKPCFAFIDASGTLAQQDRFFGVGMLVVYNAGSLTDKLSLIYQRMFAVTSQSKDRFIRNMQAQGQYQQIVKVLKKQKRFEMKFDNISPLTVSFYRDIINEFLQHNCRFTAMLVDTQQNGFDRSIFKSTWDAYTSYIATIVTQELGNLRGCNMILILDELSKPKYSDESLEDIVLRKTNNQLQKKQKILPSTFGALRIESHSNLLLQLCDILLGAVMYDYKKHFNALSHKLMSKKEPVVVVLRKGLHRQTLYGAYTVNKPLYFNVWEVIWK